MDAVWAALLHSANFATGPFSCFDYFAGAAGGAGVYLRPGHPEVTAPNRARIKEGWALPAGSPGIGPIGVGTETYAFKVIINNSRTSGLGSCAGCTIPATFAFTEILVTNVPGDPNGNKRLISPATRAYATWQDGVTPARNATWGSIKARYR